MDDSWTIEVMFTEKSQSGTDGEYHTKYTDVKMFNYTEYGVDIKQTPSSGLETYDAYVTVFIPYAMIRELRSIKLTECKNDKG